MQKTVHLTQDPSASIIKNWAKKHQSTLLLTIAQIIGWAVFYIVWRLVFYWRTFTTIQQENVSFFIIFIGTYLFYFMGFKCFYQRKWFYFILFSLTTWITATLAEYFYLIPTLISHTHPLNPATAEDSYSYVRRNTLTGIVIRDAVIFSLAGFSVLYHDAYRFRKLQKQELKHMEEMQSLQFQTNQYMQHEHFAENLLGFFSDNMHDGQLKKSFENALSLYQYSIIHTSISTVPAKEEVEFSERLYMYYCEKYPSLDINFHITGEKPSYPILTLVTEPIICNMFKHGITTKDGKMDILFDFNDPAAFKMTCSNKVRPNASFFNNPQSRGLKLLSARLKNYYGGRAKLDFNVHEQTVTVSLVILV